MAESRYYEPCPNCGAQAEVAFCDPDVDDEILGTCLACLETWDEPDAPVPYFQSQHYYVDEGGVIQMQPTDRWQGVNAFYETALTGTIQFHVF